MACIMFKNGMRSVHPGEVLMQDYIKPMGISDRALSLAMAAYAFSHKEQIGNIHYDN